MAARASHRPTSSQPNTHPNSFLARSKPWLLPSVRSSSTHPLTSREKNNASLRQLPDLGANNKPSTLRKDLWRPLYTLSLPTSHPHALAQGLDAFRRLREYRRLHELCWEPTEAMKRPYSDAQIESMQRQLNERGGSKRENVFDVVKRRKRTMRLGIVRDQKANSIADLAAVLLEQERTGRETEEMLIAERHRAREKEVEQMLRLAESAGEGGVEKIEAEAQAIQKRLDDGSDLLEGTSRRQLKRRLHDLHSRKARMIFAAKAVADAQDESHRQRMQAQRQQQLADAETARTTAPAPRSTHPLDKPTSVYATLLRQQAASAKKGAFASLDASIRTAELALADHLGTNLEAEWRVKLRHRKVVRDEMEMAFAAAQSVSFSGSFEREAEEIRRQMVEYDVELAGQDVKAVEQRGGRECRGGGGWTGDGGGVEGCVAGG